MSGREHYLSVENVTIYLEISIQKEVSGIINSYSGKTISFKDFVEDYLSRKNVRIELNLGNYIYPDYVHMEFWGR